MDLLVNGPKLLTARMTNETLINATLQKYWKDWETSRAAMQVMYPVSIAWIVVGFITVFNNAVLLVIVRRLVDAKRNFYWAVFQLTLADLVAGIMSIYVGCRRTFFGAKNSAQLEEPWLCAFDMGFLIFSVFGAEAQTFALALDRLITVTWPVLYHTTLTPYHLQTISIGFWVFNFLFVGGGFIWQKQDVPYVLVCTAPGVFTKPFFTTYLSMITVLSIIIIIMYAAIMLIVRTRLRQTRKAKGDIAAAKKQMETHILGCLTTIIAVYISTWFISTLTMEISNLVEPWIAIVGAPYFWGMMTINSATNCILYITKHEEIKSEFLKIFFGIKGRNPHLCQPSVAGQPRFFIEARISRVGQTSNRRTSRAATDPSIPTAANPIEAEGGTCNGQQNAPPSSSLTHSTRLGHSDEISANKRNESPVVIQ